MSRDDDRWRADAGDRERAGRARPDDDRGAGPIALAIVGAAAVSFALAFSVLVLCAVIFVYLFSSYLLVRIIRIVRFPLRKLLRGGALARPSELPDARWRASGPLPRALRGWRTWL